MERDWLEMHFQVRCYRNPDIALANPVRAGGRKFANRGSIEVRRC